MEVQLITGTTNPIETMYVAARTCYSSQTPSQLWEEALLTGKDKMWTLIKKVLSSGHTSIAEHISLTFAINGIDRATSHQLVRHRIAVYSQQSQRYVEIKEDLQEILHKENILNLEFLSNELKEETQNYFNNLVNKYFVVDKKQNINFYVECLKEYLDLIKQGLKPEEARSVLPNATKTNIVMTVNLRQLIHMCGLRLCTRAQTPIRELFKLIVEEVASKYNARIADLLEVQCEQLGYCPEEKGCGRMPKNAQRIT